MIGRERTFRKCDLVSVQHDNTTPFGLDVEDRKESNRGRNEVEIEGTRMNVREQRFARVYRVNHTSTG